METASIAKKWMRGEETLMVVLFVRLLVLLWLNNDSKESTELWLSLSTFGDGRLVMMTCCLVLQLLAVYNFPTRKKEDRPEIFRPGVHSGVPCVLLVPLVVLSEALGLPAPLVEVVFVVGAACALLLLAPWQLRKSCGVLYLGLLLAATVLTALCLHLQQGESLAWVCGLTTLLCAAHYLPLLCPLSFAWGELCVVCQVIGCVVFRMGAWLGRCLTAQEWPVLTDETYVCVFVSVMMVFVVMASALVLHWEWCDGVIPFLLVYLACGLMAVGVLILLTGHNPLLWLLTFLWARTHRVWLVVWWVVVVVVTGVSVAVYTRCDHRSDRGRCEHGSDRGHRASTAVRKAFHGAALCVYLPGLGVDPLLLLLASVTALAALALLEVARLVGVQGLGSAVDASFQVFVDDRDQGPVLLTHIYLLVGLSLPLWLSLNIAGGGIRIFAGVLSLGIGDTVACVVGMRYGHTKWPGTKKSVEGTGASVAAQLTFVLLATYLGWVEECCWLGTVLAVVMSSMFEAFVSQIDNLVLPLYLLAALPTAAH